MWLRVQQHSVTENGRKRSGSNEKQLLHQQLAVEKYPDDSEQREMVMKLTFVSCVCVYSYCWVHILLLNWSQATELHVYYNELHTNIHYRSDYDTRYCRFGAKLVLTLSKMYSTADAKMRYSIT